MSTAKYGTVVRPLTALPFSAGPILELGRFKGLPNIVTFATILFASAGLQAPSDTKPAGDVAQLQTSPCQCDCTCHCHSESEAISLTYRTRFSILPARFLPTELLLRFRRFPSSIRTFLTAGHALLVIADGFIVRRTSYQRRN